MSDERVPDAAMDPVMEKLRRKMVRLLAISIAVLFVGLIAVLSAVVYRTGGAGEEAARADPESPVEAVVALPPGARALSVVPQGPDRALLLLDLPDGAQQLLVLDLASGAAAARIDLRPAP